jgi:hypothetical protein
MISKGVKGSDVGQGVKDALILCLTYSKEYFWMHILPHLFAWIGHLFGTQFITIFGLSFCKNLSTYYDSY